MFLDLFSPFGHAASGPIPPSPWLLLLALGLDGYFGEMPLLFRALPHPVVLMGRAIGALDRRWNKVKDKDWVRRLKGVAALVVLVTVAGVIGLLVHGLTRLTSFGFLLEILIAGILVAQKSLYDHVMAVARSLDQAGLAGGRAAVAHIVGRDPNQLDQAGVSRAAIESAAENLSDGVVAPVFWYLIAGMPGLMIYKMVNTADSMIGHRTPRHKAFGWGAARVDDLLNLVPARLTAGLLILAAIEPKWASPSRAWATWRRDAAKHRSPNAGPPEAAMAGALGIRLSGPRFYKNEAPQAEPWIGDGRAEVTAKDIRRALRLMRHACVAEAALMVPLGIVLWL